MMKYLVPLILLLHCYHKVTGAEDEVLETNRQNAPLSRVRRGGLSMLRLGRGLQMLRLGKRAMPMLRLGRSHTDSYTPEEIRYIISLLLREENNYDSEPLRRQIPFPRYGKDLEWQTFLEELQNEIPSQERRSDFYDLPDENSPRQIRPGPRPGRFRRSAPIQPKDLPVQQDDSEEAEVNSVERTPPLPRIGREEEEEEVEGKVPLYKEVQDLYLDTAADGRIYVTDKRGMPMLRLGRAMPMLRLGKRPFKMLRLGRGSDLADESAEDKRAMPMLRLGKRPFKMLRLGKRLTSDSEKRAMPMLRLGRSS